MLVCAVRRTLFFSQLFKPRGQVESQKRRKTSTLPRVRTASQRRPSDLTQLSRPSQSRLHERRTTHKLTPPRGNKLRSYRTGSLASCRSAERKNGGKSAPHSSRVESIQPSGRTPYLPDNPLGSFTCCCFFLAFQRLQTQIVYPAQQSRSTLKPVERPMTSASSTLKPPLTTPCMPVERSKEATGSIEHELSWIQGGKLVSPQSGPGTENHP